MSPKTSISPETKVGRLLEDYPDLEETLVEAAPEFRKLRNPILRRTIARVTSLRQVASVGDISLAVLIKTLRKKAGIEESFADEGAEPDPEIRPEWAVQDRVSRSWDAQSFLEGGGHPLSRVLHDLKGLGEDDVYELVTGFRPAPLIDKALELGYQAWTEKGNPVRTYFRKKP